MFRIAHPKLYLSTAALWEGLALGLAFKANIDLVRARESAECPSCRRVDRFVFGNSRSSDIANCSICLDTVEVGQEIAAHSGDGAKHPIHKECFENLRVARA